MSRSLESRGKIDPPTDIERHPTGPTPAGEESPLPRSGPRSSRSLVHVETWQSYIGGGGGAQAGANGDKQGSKMQIKGGRNKFSTLELT